MNKTIISGNITREPKIRLNETGNGKWSKLANYTVAVNMSKTETVYIECTCFDRLAEFVEQHFKKGTAVEVSGAIRPGKPYQDKKTQEWVSTMMLTVESQAFAPSGGKSEQSQTPQAYAPAPQQAASQQFVPGQTPQYASQQFVPGQAPQYAPQQAPQQYAPAPQQYPQQAPVPGNFPSQGNYPPTTNAAPAPAQAPGNFPPQGNFPQQPQPPVAPEGMGWN